MSKTCWNHLFFLCISRMTEKIIQFSTIKPFFFSFGCVHFLKNLVL